ncbi:MAG: ATP-binding protein, partial [Bacteroidota bacterium]
AFQAGIKRDLPGSPWSDAIAEKALSIAADFEGSLWPHLFPPIQQDDSIQAAWALPIKDSSGEILGTFCGFYPKPQQPRPAEITFVRSLLSLASVAITYVADAENLKEQARQSASLLRLSTELELATDYDQVVDLLQQEIESVLGYPACWLYLYSSDRKKLRMVATRGRPGDQSNTLEPIELDSDQDEFVKALSEVEDIWVIPDARSHPITDKKIVEKMGNRLIVNMPIRILQTSLGVIGAGTFGEDDRPPPNAQQQSYWRQLAKHTGAALNRIQYLQALEQSKRELQQANEELEGKVQDRTQELELSLRSLEHFSYLASHDLREPLRMIISYLQLLERRMEDRLTGEERNFMDFAVDGARRMKELLNGILTYSRLDAKPSHRSQVDLGEVLSKVQQILTLNIEQSGAKLDVGALPTITANSQQMVLLFQHLIENAITFNQSQAPKIHISAKLQGDSWLFAVQDNGIGFEEQDAERIFLMFERLHNREDYPGNGVGLAVCQQIVQVHGGTIWATSTPGEGSCFYVRLTNA